MGSARYGEMNDRRSLDQAATRTHGVSGKRPRWDAATARPQLLVVVLLPGKDARPGPSTGLRYPGASLSLPASNEQPSRTGRFGEDGEGRTRVYGTDSARADSG